MQTAAQLTNANLGRVRMFTLVGEKLLRAPLAALFAACPEAAVQNTYGPTEATVSVTQMRMSADDFTAACHGNNTSVGGPIDGMGLHLVDGPGANEGEIVLTGPQLATGYWNDPERTARAFRTIAVDGAPVPCFHTGDWAVRRGAHLFFEERIDLQVKLRGYRIELDEVAAAIMACGWPSVCVVKRGEALAALVEDPSGGRLDAAALQEALAGKIEAYAVPAHIVAVPALPRNESDKVDRRAAATLLDTLILETDA
jgi:D-alanine--poly(phosphoribitol) ligase subunit 1